MSRTAQPRVKPWILGDGKVSYSNGFPGGDEIITDPRFGHGHCEMAYWGGSPKERICHPLITIFRKLK